MRIQSLIMNYIFDVLLLVNIVNLNFNLFFFLNVELCFFVCYLLHLEEGANLEPISQKTYTRK